VYSILELFMKLGVAYEESDVKSKRQLRAEDRRLQDGKPPRGGHRHFGYHLNCCPADDCTAPEAPVHRLRRGDHDKTNVCDACHGGCDPHTVREEEAAVLREVAERWLAGEPMRALARELQERGVPTVRGGEWTRTGLRKTLMSPRLAGIRVHRRNGEVREVKLRDWTPVFTPDLHARLITADSSSGNRRAPQRYLLTGLLVCGQCDVTLNGKQHGPDRRRYTCLQCHRNGIGAEPVDAVVWNAALGRSWHADRLDAEQMKARLDKVEAQIASDEAQRTQLDDAWADGDLSRERWARQVDRLNRRIKSMEDEARRLRAEVRRTTRGWQSLLALTETHRTADADTRRDVLVGVIRRIVLAPNRGRAGGRVDLSRLRIEWADGTVSDGDLLTAMLNETAMEAPDAEEQRRLRQQEREEAEDEISWRMGAGEMPPVMPSKRGG
jgi:hypothetical protein